jgi:fructose-1,6-bisphosphatase/inositol monophosphatase family enzyme
VNNQIVKISHFNIHIQESFNAVNLAAAHLIKCAENNKTLTVSKKSDSTLVMNLDFELESILLKNLSSLSAVSEEKPETHNLIGQDKDYFIIDPLDGTTSAKRFLNIRDSQIGFGSIVGVIKRGFLEGVVFFNAPARKIFIAQKNCGCFVGDFGSDKFTQLQNPQHTDIDSCGVLFYAGLKGELEVVKKLKESDLAENYYRFGGFANDCSRLALGIEQMQIQFSVKAWDLPAALLVGESGLDVIVNPLSSDRKKLSDWKVQKENPLISVPTNLTELILKTIN